MNPAGAVPRLGFLGFGWIGRHRMEAIANQGLAELVAVADPAPERRRAARTVAPEIRCCEHLGHLLELELDGIVIATPAALHAEHSIAALERRIAVFCQKPLGRTAAETRRVVEAARDADRLLGVDLSYRHTEAMLAVRAAVRSGSIGRPYALDLTFHNAYGPDATWFYDKASSGGGCVIDLGVHLVDLALWLLDFPAVEAVDSMLFAHGARLPPRALQVEDYATAQLRLAGNVAVRMTCSWRIHAGRDAVIEAAVFGTTGGVALRNVDGSFHDFVAERYIGTTTERLVSPPDDWGGGAANDWVRQLASGTRFDRDAERLVALASAVDAIYAGRVEA